MIQVKIKGEMKEYLKGTTYLDITLEYQNQYEDDILLVSVDGKLQELHKKLEKDCELCFLTAKDKPGYQTYQRSTILLMLKSFYEVIGSDRIEKVSVDFSMGKGLFIEPRGDFTLTQEVLDRVKETMQGYVEQKIPIMKRNVHTDEAIQIFHDHRMYDKERLFRYRRVSRVNLYSLGGFEDYYYGYMLQNTSYIKYFDLTLYDCGFILLFPSSKTPKIVEPINIQEKLFQTMQESERWSECLGIPNVGFLNEAIANGMANEIILIQEALQEKKIGQIAEEIARQGGKKFVMIAGPSSSGKTTFSHRLSVQLRAHGLHPHPIAVDNYFVNRVDTPRDEDGKYNYEILEALDVNAFNEDMNALLEGKTVEIPQYNFRTGQREYKGNMLTLGSGDILVIEGIHCLNERLSHTLPKESKYRIYISALTQLNIDEHNRIPSTDGRLIRRMVRDARTRGTTAQNTIMMWNSVRRGEEDNIFPFQEEADVMFNSASVYELAVLKQYAEPILFGIPKDSAEYMEAKRLLKFLDYFLGVSSEDIPKNSIVREFIGGSCFHV